MAEKLAFELEILGKNEVFNNIESLRKKLAELKAEKEKATDKDTFEKLTTAVGTTTNFVKRLETAQKATNAALSKVEYPEGSVNQIKAKIKELEQQFNNLDKAAQDSDFGEKLSNDIKKSRLELDKINGTLGKTGKLVDATSEGILKAFGKARIGGRIDAISSQFGALGSTVAKLSVVGVVAAGVFQAGQQIAAFAKEYDDASNVVANSTKLTGDALETGSERVLATSKTFKVSAESITSAAQELSLGKGISFTDALDQINRGLAEGKANNEEYLKSIEKNPSQFKKSEGALSDLAKKNLDALAANEALAASQGKLSKQLSRVGEALSPLVTSIKTGFVNAIATGVEWVGNFFDLIGDVGDALTSFSQSASASLNSLTFGLLGTSEAAQRAKQEQVEADARINQLLLEDQKQLSDKITKLYGRDFAEKVKGLTGIQRANFDFAVLNAKQAASEAGKSTGEGFNDGVKAGIAELEKQGFDITTLAQKEAEAAQKTLTQEAQKAAEERAKKRDEEAKRAREKLKQDREQLLKDIQQQNKEILLLQTDLNKQLISIGTSLIKDEFERRREEVKNQYKNESDTRKDAFQALQDNVRKQQEEFAKLNKNDAKAVQAQKEESEKKLAQIKAQYDAIEIASEQKKAEEIVAINKDESEKVQADKIAAAEKEIELYRKRNQLRNESLDLDAENERLSTEIINKGILDKDGVRKKGYKSERKLAREAAAEQAAADKKEFINRQEATRRELEQLNEEETQLRRLGIEQSSEQEQERANKRKALNNQLLSAESEFLDKSAAARAKAGKDEEENWKKVVGVVANYTKEALSIFEEFQNIRSARALKRIEREEKANNESIAKLTEQQAGASALQQQYIQQRIDFETKANEELARKREQIEKAQARRTRTTKAIESGVNTAVAITASLPNIPLAIAVGILGAIQTAFILAQPLASGGVVGKGNYKKIGSGVVNETPNAPTSEKGDNILTYIQNGEVVLNKEQQARIGMDTLAAAGVPGIKPKYGYADGGVVVPSFSNEASESMARIGSQRTNSAGNGSVSTEQLTAVIAATVAAVNKNTDRKLNELKVSVSSVDIDKVKAEKDRTLQAATI
jgi:hypothetical protein